MQSYKHFLVGLLYTEPLLRLGFLHLLFVSQQRGMNAAKMPFYYLTANKIRDVFHHLGP